MSTKIHVIRKSEFEDMDQVVEAHIRSIREICSRDYSPQEIDAYSDVKYSHDVWEKSITQDFHLVVEVDGKVEGFAHAGIHPSNRGEIMGLYFTPAIAGRGIGREIFERMNVFFEDHDVNQVFLTSSKTAKGFYQKMGFSVVDQVIVNICGAGLECYYMEN
ncbi:MAG: GNAT family N-acetyltransferase [Verrucomicrobiota bacterium]